MDRKNLIKISKKILLSYIFNTKEQMDKYLKEHPGADRSIHHVKPKKPKIKKDPQPIYSNFRKVVSKLFNSTPKTRDYLNSQSNNRVFKETFDYDGKTVVGYMKPWDEERNGVYLFPNSKLKFSLNNKISQSEREVATYNLDEVMGFGLVPPTCFVERVIDKDLGHTQKGTEQLGVSGIPLMKLGYDKSIEYYETKPEFRKNIQKLGVFDFIVGNMDRHKNNVILGDDNQIYAIDNGLTFPYQNGFVDDEGMVTFGIRSASFQFMFKTPDQLDFNGTEILERLVEEQVDFDKDLVDTLNNINLDSFKSSFPEGMEKERDLALERLHQITDVVNLCYSLNSMSGQDDDMDDTDLSDVLNIDKLKEFIGERAEDFNEEQLEEIYLKLVESGFFSSEKTEKEKILNKILDEVEND